MDAIYRKLASTKSTSNASLKCAIDHILDAQNKGEINEDNVLYIVENINVAGKLLFHIILKIRVLWLFSQWHIYLMKWGISAAHLWNP